MKKLLSLLSVLTISGTAAPTTIAASPSYKKQEKINNAINISYLQKNNIKRSKRSIEEEINKVYFIDENGLVRKETDVPYPITTMYVFKDPDSGQRKYGDIYFGTTNGLYLRKVGQSTTTKIEGINEPIKLISSYKNNGQVHVIIYKLIKKIIKTEKYEFFVTSNNELYYKKGSQKIKKHNLFGLAEGKVNKIEKDLNNNFYILLNNKKLWKSDYNFTNIENGSIISITNNSNNDNKIKDFIIDKFNNIFVLTEKNNVYYQKNNDNKFNKINIFTKNEQINNILYSKEEGIIFLTNNLPVLINNNQINDLLKDNNNCEIQYPLIRRPRTNSINYNDILRSNVSLNMQSPNNFRNNIEQIRIFLFNNDIITRLEYGSHQFYQLNAPRPHTRRYFSIPVQLQNESTLELVYDLSNLYLQGFINEQNGQRNYYYFNDSTLQNIEGVNNNRSLQINGSYTILVSQSDRTLNFNWNDILNAFIMISQYNKDGKNGISKNDNGINSERMQMFFVIFATAEALRFFPVASELENMARDTEIQRNYNYFRLAINNWTSLSPIRRRISNDERRYLLQTIQDYWWLPGMDEINNQPETNSILWDYYNVVFVAIVIYNLPVFCDAVYNHDEL